MILDENCGFGPKPAKFWGEMHHFHPKDKIWGEMGHFGPKEGKFGVKIGILTQNKENLG